METKKCCHCKEDLSLDSFQKNRAAPDGLQYRCKNCTKKAHILCRAKRGHLWQEKLNPWKDRPDNRERVNATTRARMARKPIEEKREESYRWILKRKYGLTPELKMALIAAQDNVCAICERPIDFKCATDHDHEGDLFVACYVSLAIRHWVFSKTIPRFCGKPQNIWKKVRKSSKNRTTRTLTKQLEF